LVRKVKFGILTFFWGKTYNGDGSTATLCYAFAMKCKVAMEKGEVAELAGQAG
jgi:hypothetical protein